MNAEEADIKGRIATLVESIRHDRRRSNQLFDYVWTMMCVRRGLMRVVREIRLNDATQLVVEEVGTGEHRLILRPSELDSEIEGLAVQALARILASTRRAS